MAKVIVSKFTWTGTKHQGQPAFYAVIAGITYYAQDTFLGTWEVIDQWGHPYVWGQVNAYAAIKAFETAFDDTEEVVG